MQSRPSSLHRWQRDISCGFISANRKKTCNSQSSVDVLFENVQATHKSDNPPFETFTKLTPQTYSQNRPCMLYLAFPKCVARTGTLLSGAGVGEGERQEEEKERERKRHRKRERLLNDIIVHLVGLHFLGATTNQELATPNISLCSL